MTIPTSTAHWTLPVDTGEVLFRFEDRRYAASLNEFDEPTGPPRVAVELQKYPVLRKTACGAWIQMHHSDMVRFVNLKARKKFAHPTEIEAMEGFVARKKRQLSIYQARTRDIQRALETAASLHHKLISAPQAEFPDSKA